MMSVQRHIKLSPIDAPPRCNAVTKVAISDSTITARKAKVIANMARANIDYLLVYADKEHGGNFEYLTGFIPRFEEAALVLHASGKIFIARQREFKTVSICAGEQYSDPYSLFFATESTHE